MTEELRPLVDATYATDGRNNILWGDSFGGLFALHVLFNHPAAYQTYLVGSPSINWSGGGSSRTRSTSRLRLRRERSRRASYSRSEEHTSELQSLMRPSSA